jgi:uncharacterized protein (DUF488 family)
VCGKESRIKLWQKQYDFFSVRQKDAAMEQKEIWTIGHSTNTLDEFIAKLKSFEIELLVDIRSFPGSRRFPHFNKEALKISLPENKIEYAHLVKLGGRRKALTNSHNTGWRVAAFRGYADYMETEDFSKAIEELELLAIKKRTAYMCSEAVWWRCHRSLVSDYLKFNGWLVMHIMGVNKAEEHPYTKPAIIEGNKLVYTPKKINLL